MLCTNDAFSDFHVVRTVTKFVNLHMLFFLLYLTVNKASMSKYSTVHYNHKHF